MLRMIFYLLQQSMIVKEILFVNAAGSINMIDDKKLEENRKSIDELYSLMDSNDDRLEYLKSKGWLYQLFFWQQIRDIKKDNLRLKSIVIKKMCDY